MTTGSGPVVRKEDLRVHFDSTDPDPRVHVVDERSRRVLIALPPDHAVQLGQALYALAERAAAAMVEIEQGRLARQAGEQ